MKSTAPLAQFSEVTEEEIIRALGDPRSGNPLVQEMARILDIYIENCGDDIRRRGKLPPALLKTKPASGFETLALQMLGEAVDAEKKAA